MVHIKSIALFAAAALVTTAVTVIRALKNKNRDRNDNVSHCEDDENDNNDEITNNQEENQESPSPLSETSIVNRWHSTAGHIAPTSFELLKKIGEGTDSEVYRGRGKDYPGVALKCIRKIINQAGETINEHMVEKEMFIHNFVSKHANISKSYGWYEDKSRNEFVYVSEWCDGYDLFHVLEQAGFRLKEQIVRKYSRKFVSALQYLHERDVIHRDVKMENVIIGVGDGEIDGTEDVTLIDFGSAIHSNMASDNTWRNGGTPKYRAPELMTTDKPFGTKIDMFAVGVMIFAMLYGRFPFTQKEIGQEDVKVSFHGGDDVSSMVKDVICGLLDRDADRRMSASDLLAHPWMVDS